MGPSLISRAMGPGDTVHFALSATCHSHQRRSLRICHCCFVVYTPEHNSDQSSALCCSPCPEDDCYAASRSLNLHVRELLLYFIAFLFWKSLFIWNGILSVDFFFLRTSMEKGNIFFCKGSLAYCLSDNIHYGCLICANVKCPNMLSSVMVHFAHDTQNKSWKCTNGFDSFVNQPICRTTEAVSQRKGPHADEHN